MFEEEIDEKSDSSIKNNLNKSDEEEFVYPGTSPLNWTFLTEENNHFEHEVSLRAKILGKKFN